MSDPAFEDYAPAKDYTQTGIDRDYTPEGILHDLRSSMKDGPRNDLENKVNCLQISLCETLKYLAKEKADRAAFWEWVEG